jgi:hypothetical protein
MNDMERRKFEENIQGAFSNAEVQPSDKVWSNIELDLMKADGEKMKRRVVFYQLLAAASISFAVLFGGVGFYLVNQNQQIAKATSELKGQKNQPQDSEILESTKSPQIVSGDTLTSPASGDPRNTAAIESPTQADSKNDGQLNDGRIDNSKNVGKYDDEIRPLAQSQVKSESKNSINNIATDDPQKMRLPLDKNRITKDLNENDRTSEVANLNDDLIDNFSSKVYGIDEKATNNSNAVQNLAVTPTSGMSEGGNVPGVNERPLPPLYTPEKRQLVFQAEEKIEADPVALMLAGLKDREDELARAQETKKGKKQKSEYEKLWTSVAFAAGAFNSIGSSADPSSFQTTPAMANSLSNSAVVQNQTQASGIAYTVGISMGTRVSERWVVQGGFNYLTQTSDYTSTQAVQESGNFKAASINEYRTNSSITDAEFIPTAPYTVNSSNEYISVPLQAGYLIVKRKFVWQLNAGISTDLFLQNTIDPEGNIEKSSNGAGADSPFRTFNFSCLVGSEVSYRFGEHYRLGINPGVRYPFNSIYKDNLGVESTPLTFDIGVRFRYIFR